MSYAPESPTQFQEIEENSLLDMQVCAAYKPQSPNTRAVCDDESERGFVCTRPRNHEGPHVAHLDEQSAAAWWPQ